MQEKDLTTISKTRSFTGFVSNFEVKKHLKASSAKEFEFKFIKDGVEQGYVRKEVSHFIGSNGNILKAYHDMFNEAPSWNKLVVVEIF